MIKFFEDLKSILPLTKNSILPAVILAVSLVCFYALENLEEATKISLHSLFYFLVIISLICLIIINRTKPSMFIGFIVLGYVIINYLKTRYGEMFASSPYYINLCTLIPFNLVVFYFIPQRKFFSRENFFILLVVLVEISIYENLSANNILIGYNISQHSNTTLNEFGLLFFMIGAVIMLFDVSINGKILQTYLLFAFIEIMFGFVYSGNSTALTIFFTASVLSIFCGICHETYFEMYQDAVTHLGNRKTYNLSEDKFPIKYSIGIIHIDDYGRLAKELREKDLNKLIKMIANKIKELYKSPFTYRCSSSEFIIIFNDETKEEGFEHIEKIRRNIAGSEFLVNKKKANLKVTVSGSVADKKRRDTNSHEALARARKILEKTNKFSQNITTMA